MPAQWFAVPFVRRDDTPYSHGRYCKLADFADEIAADGGKSDHFECGGGPNTSYITGVCFGKVGGVTQATLDAIGAEPDILEVPPTLILTATSLGVLTNPERNFMERTLTKALGYTDAEIDAWLGGQTIQQKTYGQFLDFLASRWYRPVWDPPPAGPQIGWQGNSYPGVVAVDGRTTSTGVTSEPWLPLPKTPAEVALAVPST